MRWLGRGYQPSRRAWYYFRDRSARFIHQVNQSLLQKAIDDGHTDGQTGALDGTSKASYGSRHRMINQATLDKRKQILEEAIQSPSDDPAQTPRWVPTTQSGRNELLNRMQIASKVLEDRHAKNLSRPKSKQKLPEKIVVSLSDPDAPLGRDKLKTFRPMYTVQKVTDPASGLILDYRVTTKTNDSGMFPLMAEQLKTQLGSYPSKIYADGGYSTIHDVTFAKENEIDLIAPVSASGANRRVKLPNGQMQIPRGEFQYDPSTDSYHCPQGKTLHARGKEKKWRDGDRYAVETRYQCDVDVCAACPLASRCYGGKTGRIIKRTEGEEHLEAQREKMSSPEVVEDYKRRGSSIEPSFGDEKQNLRHTVFHGYGRWRAAAETGLLVLAQNVRRLFNLTLQTHPVEP